MSTLQGNTTTIENLLRSVNNLPNVGADDAVLYIDQTLTDAQKAQARTNIGAASAEEVAGKMDKVTGTPDQVVGFDEAGNPVAREAPSGGGGVSSWNDLTDKPFGDIESVVLDEQSVEVTGSAPVYITANTTPSIGNEVVVQFDGVTYICTVLDFYGLPFVGNKELFGETSETSEPFAIGFEGGKAAVLVQDKTRAHSIKMSAQITVQIPNKYVNTHTKFYISFDDNILYTTPALETAATNEELAAALRLGPIILSLFDVRFYCPVDIQAGLETGYYAVSVVSCDGGTMEPYTYYTAEYTG